MEEFNYSVTRTMFTKPVSYIRYLKKRKEPYLVRATTESTIIIVNDTKLTFFHSSLFPLSKVFLFGVVNRDVTNWLKDKGDLSYPPSLPSNKINYNYDDDNGVITGTDLNHAYWRIAYVKGFISEKTYVMGLDPECKALRLSTISVLGRKKWYRISDGENYIETVLMDEGSQNKRYIFAYVRYICFQMMYNLSLILGDDFDSWKVDCIYYRDTPQNREIVYNYFNSKNMTYKQLEF